jgi:hypothetical protein
METKERLAEMRSERKRASTDYRLSIECVEANEGFINQLTEDFSWWVSYSTTYGLNPPYKEKRNYYIQAQVHCDNEASVKDACRLARSLVGVRSSDKSLSNNSGTMTYYHQKTSEEKDSWGDRLKIGNSISVSGGNVTPGCTLVEEITWSEPYKQTRYRMECGKE